MEKQELTPAEQVLKKYGIVDNGNQMAIKIGASRSTISKMLRNKNENGISEELLNKIIKIYGINDKSFGKDLKLATTGNQIIESSIPYFSDVNASAGLQFLTDYTNQYDVTHIKIPGIDAQAFINVFGDSMYPKYSSGQIIGIKEVEKQYLHFGYAYVVEMHDGEIYLKYIKPGKKKEYWELSSENSFYPPRDFLVDDIRKVYIIKAVIEKTTM